MSFIFPILVTCAVSLIIFITKKGLHWSRIALVGILAFLLISFFIPDNLSGRQTSILDLAIKYHNYFAFLGIVTIILNIVLFLSNSKKAYLLGMCLYFLNFVLYFSSPGNPNAPTPSIFGDGLLISILGILIFYYIAIFLNPEIMKNPNPQLVIRVKELTFEHLALNLPTICTGVLAGIAGLFFIKDKNPQDFNLSVGMFIFSFCFIFFSALSLIPKRIKIIK